MPQLEQGQIFPSLADFKKALQEWAVEKGFTPAILDSDTHRVRAGCRSSSDCTFRIRANFSTKHNYAKVTTIQDEHTCSSRSGEQEVKRAAACRVKFLSEAVPKLMAVTEETPTKAIIEAIERRYGQKIAMRQAQKVKSLLCPKDKGSCKLCGNKWHGAKRCPRLPQSPNHQDDDSRAMDLDENEEPFSLTIMPDADPDPPSPHRESPLGHSRTPNGPQQPLNNTNLVQSASIQPITPPTMTAKPPTVNPPPPRNNQNNNTRHNSMTHPKVPHHPVHQNNPPQPTASHNPIPPTWDSENWDPQLTQRTPFHHHHHHHQQTPTTQSHPENPLSQLTTTVATAAVSAAVAIPQIASFSMPPATPVRQDKSIEIARLLEQAGRMMQEAAKLTFEAARLTATTANS